MDSEKKATYLNAARQLAENIVKRAKKDETGAYWETVTYEPPNKTAFSVSEALYNGVSGIALFLAELYRHTGETTWLNTARDAFRWLDHRIKSEAISQSFFTGRLGVSFAMLRMAEITGEDVFREKALQAAEGCRKEHAMDIDDLLNGRAGQLVALLHLHAATGASWILEVMNRITETLFERANPGPKGVSWDRSEQNIRDLCGFSHGVAGMGFAFMEMGHYLNNPAFYELARQALAYETVYFNPEPGSWPDHRKGIYSVQDQEEHLQHYLDKDLDFFIKPGYMDAWCHGAPGIGLSRIRAYERTGEKIYLEHFHQACRKVRHKMDTSYHKVKGINFTICHGVYGDLEVLLEGRRLLDDPDLSALAQEMADPALDQLAEGIPFISGYLILDPNPECTSLFMGTAGVAHTLLRIIDPETPSVLSPLLTTTCSVPIDARATPNLALTTGQLFRRLLSGPFARLLTRAETLFPDKLASFLDGLGREADFLADFKSFVDQAIETLPESQRIQTRDLYRLEVEKLRTELETPSFSLIRIKLIATQGTLEALEPGTLLDAELVLDEDVSLIETTWNWTRGEPQPGPVTVLLKPLPSDSLETTLNDFTSTVLTIFRNGKRVREAVDEISRAFELETEAERKQVRGLILEQIREALSSGLLLFAS